MTMDATPPPAPVRANTFYSNLGLIPFALAHFLPFLAYFTGVTTTALWLFFVLFFVRQWAVTAGYHLNKQHWNTVRLDGSVPDEALRQMIDESWCRVVTGLKKSERQALLGPNTHD